MRRDRSAARDENCNDTVRLSSVILWRPAEAMLPGCIGLLFRWFSLPWWRDNGIGDACRKI